MNDIKYYTSEILPLVPLTESDFHGASFILNKLYNNALPVPIIGSTLKHGWTPNRFIKNIRQVIHWGGENDTHLCFNKFQQSYLETNGYGKTFLIGAPFIHAHKLIAPLRIKKNPNSLLIMPQHTLKHVQANLFSIDFLKESLRLAEEAKLTNISICLHRQSQDKQTINFSKDNNINIIIGASEFDSKSLINQAILMSQFTHVHTNSFGSHLVYALYSDCKIKISHLYKHKRSELFQHQWYAENPEVAEIALQNEENITSIYPEFFQNDWISKMDAPLVLKEEISADFQAHGIQKIFSTNPIKNIKWLLKNSENYHRFTNLTVFDNNF